MSIKKYQFILGKLIPFWLIGFIVLTIGLLISRFVYGIIPVGNIGLIYLFAAVYLLALLGIGLLISTVAESQQQAMFMAGAVASSSRCRAGVYLIAGYVVRGRIAGGSAPRSGRVFASQVDWLDGPIGAVVLVVLTPLPGLHCSANVLFALQWRQRQAR